MNKINRYTYFNTLSKEDKLRIILNLCENHVINDRYYEIYKNNLYYSLLDII